MYSFLFTLAAFKKEHGINQIFLVLLQVFMELGEQN